MDRRITSRLNMANAVKEVCDTRPDVVATVPAFVLLVAALGERITALRALIKQLSKKESGLALDKTNWKERLSLLLSVVCGAGVSYARKVNNVVLEKNFGFAETILSNMRDTELIETAQSIIDLQGTVAAELVDYGITNAFMNDVRAALTSFEEKNPKPMVNIYTGEALRNEAFDKAFELSDFVLQNLMKSALVFKVMNPNFYLSLEKASHISKVGVRHDENPAAANMEMNRVQPSPNTNDMLKDAVETLNTNAEPTSNGATEPIAVQEPSLNEL